jgi:RIO kinase 1
MSHYQYGDSEDFSEETPHIRNIPSRRANRNAKAQHKVKTDPSKPQAVPPADRQENFDFTYMASRHEREWIVNSLGGFYDQHWLDDVLRLVQGGKEAHVYQCRANPSVSGLQQGFLAAKVYRPRQFRSLKNDAVYRQGRQHIDGDGRVIQEGGMLHAMALRTAWGLELLHTSWIEHEVKTMQALHAAGADVPLYLASGNNAILMSYIGDETNPAPLLNSLELDSAEARSLFQRVLHNIEIMLAKEIVHGDLSAYNILYWQGEITLIDFPQAIDPRSNQDAFPIFVRDVTRICEYFMRQGVRSSPVKLAQGLWTAHGYSLSPEIHPSLLNPDDRSDRRYWKKASTNR